MIRCLLADVKARTCIPDERTEILESNNINCTSTSIDGWLYMRLIRFQPSSLQPLAPHVLQPFPLAPKPHAHLDHVSYRTCLLVATLNMQLVRPESPPTPLSPPRHGERQTYFKGKYFADAAAALLDPSASLSPRRAKPLTNSSLLHHTFCVFCLCCFSPPRPPPPGMERVCFCLPVCFDARRNGCGPGLRPGRS